MDINPMLEGLREASSKEDRDKALENILNAFLSPENEDMTNDLASTFTEKGLLDDLIAMVTDSNHTSLVAQILAEVAKEESVREGCVEKGFVPVFLHVLEKDEDLACTTQACRALGNMCFDNDGSRDVVDENNGIPILLGLLQSLLETKDPEVDKLRTIATGFLLNLTNSNEVLQQKAIEGGALDLLASYLRKFEQNEGLCNMVLVTISSLTDSEICKEKLLSSSLCSTLVDFLRSTFSEVHYETIMELLVTLSEWDEVKDLLAKTELCNYLIMTSETDPEEEDTDFLDDGQQKIKMASDLLIMLLTGEKSMEIMFADGKGEIFATALRWLDSSVEHLQLSGALAIGNFARSDEHCRFLVQQGVVKHLLTLVKPVYGENKPTLEHAALSALRNLAIPASNKAALIAEGVIDAVLVMVDTEMLAVTFKMLGVLRMLVDGQEEAAIKLGQDREFVTRLVEWSSCEEHPGVRGESSRLLAWIVKNARTAEVMKNLIHAEAIPHLVAMTTSEHVVMQNEALVALTLIATSVLADAALPLKQADLSEVLLSLLKNEKTLPEIICNSLTLVKSICAAGNLRDELISSGIAEMVKQLVQHDEEKVREAAKGVMGYIDEVPQVDR